MISIYTDHVPYLRKAVAKLFSYRKARHGIAEIGTQPQQRPEPRL